MTYKISPYKIREMRATDTQGGRHVMAEASQGTPKTTGNARSWEKSTDRTDPPLGPLGEHGPADISTLNFKPLEL